MLRPTSVLLCALLAVSSVGASEQPGLNATAMAADAKERNALAAAVTKGELTPAQAIARLRAPGTMARRPVDADAQFAFDAIAIGERLAVKTEYAKAEPFFQAAEEALVAANARTTAPKDKAMQLKKLALLRLRYLQKGPQAAADIEAAYALNPEDKTLQGLHRRLATPESAALKSNPANR